MYQGGMRDGWMDVATIEWRDEANQARVKGFTRSINSMNGQWKNRHWAKLVHQGLVGVLILRIRNTYIIYFQTPML